MLTIFIRWFHAPIFPENEEKTHKAMLLNAILNINILALPVMFTVIVLGGDIPHPERISVVIACAWLIFIGLKTVMRSGKVALAGIATVVILFTCTTISIYNIGTVRIPATSVYIFINLIAGLVIHRRAMIWTTILSFIAVIMLWLGEKNNLLPSPGIAGTTITQVITFIVLFAVTTVLIAIAINNVNQSLARVLHESTEHMRAIQQEVSRRTMMEKVIRLGKTVTEQTSDFHEALYRIWDGVRNGLGFDRAAIFLYHPDDKTMWGSYGTNRLGEMSEEWGLNFSMFTPNSTFQTVLGRPDGFYFTKDYAGERNLSARPGHPMEGVEYYAAVACWSGDKPVGIICVDQLLSGRVISEEQLEALRLFAGYAGLAIENARLNAELEGRMRERENFIRELGSRNAELERFTYTVSHDLKSPLVTIRGFLGMLKKDITENKQDKIQKDFDRIAEAAEKMGTLLSELLQLSRIGRIVNPPTEIDLASLVREALETLDGNIHARNVEVVISPNLPIIHADRVRLREVFENLIDNAIKYMGDQPNPRIEIGKREDDVTIYVKDNGIGIEPQFQAKIFGLFEKLDSAVEGTGIGLALVKRIIEVHGGRIWVESEGKGKGSTFCFTIPETKSENKPADA